MRTKIIALLMLCLCLGGAFAQASDDWYQNKPIRSISFEGLKNIASTELDGIFASYLGKEFSDDIYWEILQKMYALEYFEDIQPMALPGDPEKTSVLLQFTIVEKPVVRLLKFVGNANLRTSDLLEKVTLKEGDVYNEVKVRLDERAIRDYYLDKGYANAKVSSEKTINNDKSITLYFNIIEGKQTVISSITFEGNQVMSSKTLKATLELKEAKFLTPGTFKESTLEADKLTIEKYYRERGYIDAKVENVVREIDAESNPDKNLLKINFIVREGDQYTYGGTTIEGNHIFSTDELLSRIHLKEGDVLNLGKFDEGFQAIADVYYESGYTSNYINRKESRDPDKKRVSYAITIGESDRSHIEHIIIKGNTKTKKRVITRELMLEEGDIFSKSKLIDSMRNLYNLRYFSTVAPEIKQGSEQNLIDVEISLEEQSTASVQFGMTYSGVTDTTSFPLSVFLEWKESNFNGNGQTISVNTTLSIDTQSVKLGYSEAWFLGSPLTVDFSLEAAHESLSCYQDSIFPIFDDTYYDNYGIVPDPYTSYDEYYAAQTLYDAYKMKYDHFAFTLGASTGYRWITKLAMITLRGGISFSVVQNVYDASLYRPADKDIRSKHGSWNWNNSIWTRLSFDQRDVNYDPSTGWFLSEQVSYYGLIPTIETQYYLRFDTKAEAYATLVDLQITDDWKFKAVLAGFTTFSVQTPVTSTKISDTNKLYIDGMFTGRGWNKIYSTVKGNVLLNHSIELRIPLAPGVASLDFYFDAAAIKKDLADLSTLGFGDYYYSFGPGLRFAIPQFPLRLLFANRFQIKDGAVKWANGKGPDWSFVLSFNIANL